MDYLGKVSMDNSIIENMDYLKCKQWQCVYLIDRSITQTAEGTSWSWSYGNWIYNYLCNQCLSPL